MDATEAQLRFGASLTHSSDTNHSGGHSTTAVVNNSKNNNTFRNNFTFVS